MGIESEIWVYWLCCLAAAAVIAWNWNAIPLLLSPVSKPPFQGRDYPITLAAAWAASLLNAGAYVSRTHKLRTGTYTVPTLVAYSILNGALETLMFVFWFLASCWIARSFTRKPLLIFAGGYTGYAAFSGIIHGFFWMRVLPAHIPAASVMPLILAAMSLLWMWLLWRYRALIAIMMMHMVIDFLMIGHLNSHWFESAAAR